MRTRLLDEKAFLHDVRDHKLTVFRDDGIYRHVRLARPGTGCMHFDLITWPGYLAYVGDMGAFTFTRLFDMFDFFRGSKEGNRDKIDFRYWAEKLEATDRCGGHVEYSPDLFRERVREDRFSRVLEAGRAGYLTKEQRRELWEAIDDEVLSKADEGEAIARSAACEFSWRPGGRGNELKSYSFDFGDFLEYRLTVPSHRFLWACYAIAWGIQQYDLATKLPAIAEKEVA